VQTWKVVTSCLHRKILVTEIVLLQTVKLPTTVKWVAAKKMNKGTMPSPTIMNLIMLKTKITCTYKLKNLWRCQLCLKEIKYAAKDNKDVPFFHHSSKWWAIGAYPMCWEDWIRIGYFIVVCSVTWPLDGCEAGVDLVLLQTLLLLLCKTSCSDAN